MDIFKKLTKGIKSSKISTAEPSREKEAPAIPVPCTAAKELPKELDFFNDAVQEENVISPTSDVAASTAMPPFKTTEELGAFRAANHIRLVLHETSDNLATSDSVSVHHVTDLNDPEQILPVRAFSELSVSACILQRMQQVRAQDELRFSKERKRRAEALLDTERSSPLITTPTAVQMQAIPVMLKGRDMIVMAPTGSGKTLAFTLGILGRLILDESKNENGNESESESQNSPSTSQNSKNFKTSNTSNTNSPKALIISPTRELADQITEHLCRFIPIGEKGRPLLHVTHLTKSVAGLFTIDELQMLILDEADRLLADGFDEQLDELLVAMREPGRVQKALFSATMASGIESTARSIMNAPFRVVCGCVDPNVMAVASIKQELVYCGSSSSSASASRSRKPVNYALIADESTGKLMALKQMLLQGRFTPPCLIFVGSAVRAERLFHDLITWSATALSRPLPIEYLHSGRDQQERTAVIEAFRAKKLWFLITTDVLARGLDFPPLSAVINYDFPDSTATYIHRIGRTGRAGRSGEAVTFYTQADLGQLRIVVNVARKSGCVVPDWMIENYTKSKGQSRLKKKMKHQKTPAEK
jgi:superfamily II DNA/RNA helicase